MVATGPRHLLHQQRRLRDLRHWSATSFGSGHDVRPGAGRLGHSNAAMTLRVYAHALERTDQAVALTLAGALDDGTD